jgi:hypothetical protein
LVIHPETSVPGLVGQGIKSQFVILADLRGKSQDDRRFKTKRLLFKFERSALF